MNRTRFKCIVCGKVTAGRRPRGPFEAGDGSCVYPRRHLVDGKLCPGVYHDAEWVHGEVRLDKEFARRKAMAFASRLLAQAKVEVDQDGSELTPADLVVYREAIGELADLLRDRSLGRRRTIGD